MLNKKNKVYMVAIGIMLAITCIMIDTMFTLMTIWALEYDISSNIIWVSSILMILAPVAGLMGFDICMDYAKMESVKG